MAQDNKVHVVKVGEYHFKVRSEDMDAFKARYEGQDVRVEEQGSYELKQSADPADTIETAGALTTAPQRAPAKKTDRKE